MCDHRERRLVEVVRKPAERANPSSRLLDVIGSHRELTVIGHLKVIEMLPFCKPHNLDLLDQYYREPGNYTGRRSPNGEAVARLLDYGNDYIALELYDDITRPEVGEILLRKGWKLISTATVSLRDQVYLAEKWSNISVG